MKQTSQDYSDYPEGRGSGALNRLRFTQTTKFDRPSKKLSLEITSQRENLLNGRSKMGIFELLNDFEPHSADQTACQLASVTSFNTDG